MSVNVGIAKVEFFVWSFMMEFYKINRTDDEDFHLFRAIVALNGTANKAVFIYFSDTIDSHKS